ncbi:class I SAM-dependent methyltransferase [Dehalococcoidia bacterium]|nr:class I SAM-dependent methyltransferase [Dehalococcoidia bacterium]
MKTEKEKPKLTPDKTTKKLKDIAEDSGFINEYYIHARSLIEKEKLSPQEEERINETISLIPEDCCSILDAGCGDGRITNPLTSGYGRVVGLERSQEALRHVKAEKILGSIESLPFPDKEFDLVLCCEVLEHLPFKVYPRVLTELERVARKYIIVTVPNNEDVRRALITCQTQPSLWLFCPSQRASSIL